MKRILPAFQRQRTARLNKGYMPLYHADEPNRCPSCGRQHWIIGRMVAECAFCSAALPLENFSTYSAAPRFACSNNPAEDTPDYLRAAG